MLQNFVKQGQQWVLVFDQPLLDLLHLDPESPVELIPTGNSITIKSAAPANREAIIQAARDKIHTKYAEVFKKLAE